MLGINLSEIGELLHRLAVAGLRVEKHTILLAAWMSRVYIAGKKSANNIRLHKSDAEVCERVVYSCPKPDQASTLPQQPK